MTPLLGSISMFAGNFAPVGYLLCQGQLLSIQEHAALFSLLGTNYGGDGVQTFGIPDLRGRAAAGQGQGPGLSPYTVGQSGGSVSVTLLLSQIPSHNHTINAVATTGASSTPAGNLPALGGKPDYYSTVSSNTTMSASMVGFTGSSTPFSIISPYLVINFIIATVGIFPSRN